MFLTDNFWWVAFALLLAVGWLISAAASGDNLSLIVPMAVAGAIPVTIIAFQAVIRLRHAALLAILAAAPVMLSILWREREIGGAGLDPQSVMKIAVWGLMVAIGLFNLPRVIPLLADLPMAAFGFYCVLAVGSTIYSPAPALTFTTAMSMVGYLMFAGVLVSEVPYRRIYVTLAVTLGLWCLANLLMVLISPDTAFSFEEAPLPGHAAPPIDYRLRGIAGHPNSLALQAGISATIIFGAFYYGYLRRRVFLPLFGIAVFTVLATQSRTALLSLTIAFLLQARRYIIPLMLIGLLGLVVIEMTGFVDVLLGMVGRGGDKDEAVSMSGRTELWEFVIAQIMQQPVIGHGFNSFETNASKLWTGLMLESVSTHNTYLEVLYCTGIFGAIPFIGGLLVMIYRYLFQPHPPRDVFFILVILNSFTEVDILSMAVIPTLTFFVILAIDASRRLRGI